MQLQEWVRAVLGGRDAHARAGWFCGWYNHFLVESRADESHGSGTQDASIFSGGRSVFDPAPVARRIGSMLFMAVSMVCAILSTACSGNEDFTSGVSSAASKNRSVAASHDRRYESCLLSGCGSVVNAL